MREVSFARGNAHFQRGELEASRHDLEAALAAAREAGDSQLQVDAATGLVGYWRGRDFARASELTEETVAASEGMPPWPASTRWPASRSSTSINSASIAPSTSPTGRSPSRSRRPIRARPTAPRTRSSWSPSSSAMSTGSSG